MTTNDFRSWLATLADARATVPAEVVLYRLDQVQPEVEEPDRLLDVEETAERIGVDKRWVYRRVKTLPFAVKTGPNTLRFSLRGLERWLATRA